MQNFMADQATLAQLLQGASTRILDIVDMQGDFIWKHGALGIHPDNGSREDASTLIVPTNQFFNNLPAGSIDLVLAKFDTHFVDEYAKSPESQLFPTPHCIFGTPGWNLAVDIAPLVEKFPTYILAKNEFDMWGSNPTRVNRWDIRFKAPEHIAYDKLFFFLPLRPGEDPATRLGELIMDTDVPRDRFFASDLTGTVVLLCGVASDFCDDQAMLGYLKCGATVIAIDDLTRGIGGPGSPAPETGAMRDVVAAQLAANPEFAGRLYTAQSADILECLNGLAVTPKKPAPMQRPVAGLRR